LDPDIVERARNGDRDAYEHLATSAAHRLYPVAVRILRDRDLADDALQRTLVTIWRELPKLRDAKKFDAWSYRLLVRFCTGELGRRRRISGRVTDLNFEPSVADGVAGVADRDQLDRAFRRLSPAHRAVVVAVYYEGLQSAEVATRLGISPGTVASRLHYAMRTLRAAVEADSRSDLPPEMAR
jgi:RNA polymerase sigma-70 factor (ECF subfamily)